MGRAMISASDLLTCDRVFAENPDPRQGNLFTERIVFRYEDLHDQEYGRS